MQPKLFIRRLQAADICRCSSNVTNAPGCCGQGREVENRDVFRYNRDFAAALYRVKINAIQLKETVEENKKTNDQVLQDRQYQARLSWQGAQGQAHLRQPRKCVEQL